MKKILMLALAISLVASVAMADVLGVYADQAGETGCNFVNAAPGPVTWWVVHKAGAGGTTASDFAIVMNTDWNAALSASSANQDYVVIGDPLVDVTVAYGFCVAAGSSVPVLKISGYAFTAGSACQSISLTPPAGSPFIINVDCQFVEYPATSTLFTINGDATCPCIVATEQSTWGKVKSLYR